MQIRAILAASALAARDRPGAGRFRPGERRGRGRACCYDRNRDTPWLAKKTGIILERMPSAQVP